MPCVTNKIREMDKKYKSKKFKKDVVIASKVYEAFSQMKTYLEKFKVGKEPMSYATIDKIFGGISRADVLSVITTEVKKK